MRPRRSKGHVHKSRRKAPGPSNDVWAGPKLVKALKVIPLQTLSVTSLDSNSFQDRLVRIPSQLRDCLP